LWYAFSFFALVFIEWYRGIAKGKLKGVTAVFDQGKSGVVKFDELGDIILLNTHSRCGGIQDEWMWKFDASKFVPQLNDGIIIRQNDGGHGL
jgi:hypothetical protein